MSSGPSVKAGNTFSSPRISMAFAGMPRLSFLINDGLQEIDDVPRGETGFRCFAQRLAQQLSGALGLGVAAAIDGGTRDERAEALPAVDDPVALELLVGALDGDDADHELFGQTSEGRERRAGGE